MIIIILFYFIYEAASGSRGLLSLLLAQTTQSNFGLPLWLTFARNARLSK